MTSEGAPVINVTGGGLIGSVKEFVPGCDVSVYIERLENLFFMNKITEDAMKKAIFVGFVGDDTYKVLKNAIHPATIASKTYQQLVEVLKAKYAPRHSIIAERFKFYRQDQQMDETVSEYIMELQALSEKCEFGDFLSWALRDRLVMGLKEKRIQEKLLSLDASFEESQKAAIQAELTRTDVGLMNPGSKVDWVKNNRSNDSRRQQSRKKDVQGVRGRSRQKEEHKGSHKTQAHGGTRRKIQCYRCHQWGDHFAANCPQKRQKTRRVDHTEISSESEGDESYGAISSMFLNKLDDDTAEIVVTRYYDVSQEENVPEGHREDGSYVRDGELRREDEVQKAVHREDDLSRAMDELLESESLDGEIFDCSLEEEELLLGNWLDKIIPNWQKSLSGGDGQNLGVNQLFKEDIIFQKFSNVFKHTEESVIRGHKAVIVMKEDCVPVFHKPYAVPYGVRDKVAQEINRLIKAGVLISVDYSDWASPIVVVPKKNGDIRVCVDCKVTINKFVQLAHYPLPTLQEICNKLRGAKFFCVLDLTGAYQQLEECHENLIRVIQRLEKFNVKVKKSKCLLYKDQVEFLGHVLCAEGVRPMAKKLEEIKQASRPRDVTSLKAYLGLLTYYGKFIPNLSMKLAPLYELLKAGEPFRWSEENESVFQDSKNWLSESDLLTHYSPDLPEKNYSIVEREALALVFAVKKFHQYIYGRSVTVYTDHQCLRELFGGERKNSAVAAARIQRWSIFLGMYDLRIIYKKGIHNGNADFLSRYPLSESTGVNDAIVGFVDTKGDIALDEWGGESGKVKLRKQEKSKEPNTVKRKCKQKEPLKENQDVFYFNTLGGEWIRAKIVRRLSKTVYLCDLRGTVKKCHRDQLKPFQKKVTFVDPSRITSPSTPHREEQPSPQVSNEVFRPPPEEIRPPVQRRRKRQQTNSTSTPILRRSERIKKTLSFE
ncbi:uncharacterized protein LOC129809154 [Phlebotomus papatasi]|uniref:uncharacterized protein LOC129809154 n=1 Tax=Phlebotomus papatasi TaxID=29031 RepID=UPI0024841460|nr:uncharacterized protein LOC129809154 [Phlebotomus papatasi]